MCIECYTKLYASFNCIEGMVQSMIVMAIQGNVLGVSESNVLIQKLHLQRDSHQVTLRTPTQQKVVGSYIMDRYLHLTDPAAASVESLVEKFEEITLFNEFLDAIDEDA